MGLFTFIQEAGEKLFGIGEAKASTPTAAAPAPERVAELNKVAGDAIAVYIQKMNLPVSGLAVAFDGATAAVTVSGTVPDQATKEKVVLCCGNVQHVSKVNDMLTVETPQPESQMHVVDKGDNLSKISAKYYGTPNKYMVIFEANKPMLSHPDKIYPGQALRIPPAA
jgi:nucleoid-associated protein YgaU